MNTERKRDNQFDELPTHTLKKLDEKLVGIMGNIRERGEALQRQTAERHEKSAARAGAAGLTAAISGAAVIVGATTLGATLAPAALSTALAVAAASGVKMVYHAAMERAGTGVREHFDYRNDMAKNVLKERNDQSSPWVKLKETVTQAVAKHLPGANKQPPEQARNEARAEAYGKLPEKEAVAKFPELAPAFSVTKAAENRLAQMGYPSTSPMAKATMEDFREQVMVKIKTGALVRDPEHNRSPREPAKERNERELSR